MFPVPGTYNAAWEEDGHSGEDESQSFAGVLARALRAALSTHTYNEGLDALTVRTAERHLYGIGYISSGTRPGCDVVDGD